MTGNKHAGGIKSGFFALAAAVTRLAEVAEKGPTVATPKTRGEPGPLGDMLVGSAPTPKPVPPPEADGDFLKRIGTDATLWADEFHKRYTVLEASPVERQTREDIRHSVFGWFANAIAAGRSAAHSVYEGDAHRFTEEDVDKAERRGEQRGVQKAAQEIKALIQGNNARILERDRYYEQVSELNKELESANRAIINTSSEIRILKDEFATVRDAHEELVKNYKTVYEQREGFRKDAGNATQRFELERDTTNGLKSQLREANAVIYNLETQLKGANRRADAAADIALNERGRALAHHLLRGGYLGDEAHVTWGAKSSSGPTGKSGPIGGYTDNDGTLFDTKAGGVSGRFTHEKSPITEHPRMQSRDPGFD